MSSPNEALLPFSAVVLTGGSSGIGKSFIELVAEHRPGTLVCNLSRRAPEAEVGSLILRHFTCDLAKADAITAAAAGAAEVIGRERPEGRILLINNSGFGSYGPFPEPNLSRHLEMLDVNLRGLVQLTGLFLPLLRRRGGAIINVASTAAFQPTPFMATYGATKAFVLHWTLALREELRGTGVHALALCPGPTDTAFFRQAGAGEAGVATGHTPAEVAEAGLRALAAGRAETVVGWRNKLLTAASWAATKPFAARVARSILLRWRLKRVGP